MRMKVKEYIRPRFRKLKDSEYMDFWYSLRDAKKINNHGEFVILREQELYQKCQNFMIGNGIAGFSIMDSEMISVHKNNKKADVSKVCHILPKMVRCAFKYGAKYGDCYGEFLADYYMRSGFIVVAKLPFDNLGDNPNDWEFDKFGKPDVYVLMRGVRNVSELDRLKKKNEILGLDAVKDIIPTFTDYEQAEEYRANLYSQVSKYGYKNRLKFIQELKTKSSAK